MKKNYFLPLVALLLCLFGYHYYLRPTGGTTSKSDAHEPKLNAPTLDKNLITRTEPQLTNSNISSTNNPALDHPSSSSKFNLQSAFEKSINLRQFIETAKLHPKMGGYAYGLSAILLCTHLNDVLNAKTSRTFSFENATTDHAIIQRRQNEFEHLKQSCQGVTKDEFNFNAQRDFAKRGQELHDPYLSMMGWGDKNQGESEKIMNQAFETNDALLFSQYYKNVLPLTTKGYMFGDKVYTPGSKDEMVLTAAIALVPCESGIDCNVSRKNDVIQCALETDCIEGIKAQVIRDLQDDPILIQQATELSKKIAGDFRNKNTKLFMAGK